MFERMKPMFLSTMFSSDEENPAGGGSVTSVEMELYKMSKHRKLVSAGLETAAYQMSVFDSIPYAAQAKMLVAGLAAPTQIPTRRATRPDASFVPRTGYRGHAVHDRRGKRHGPIRRYFVKKRNETDPGDG